MNTRLPARELLKLFGFFLLFYALFLPLWLGLKAPYQNVVNTLSFKAAGRLYDIKLIGTKVLPDGTTVMTATNRYASVGLDGRDKKVVFDAILDIDAITFNVPMTLALILAIATVMGTTRKEKIDAVVNGMVLLVALHFLTMFVISLSIIIGTTDQSKDLAFYLQHKWMPKELLINLGSLLSSYAARFEPFLISVFVWWQLSMRETGNGKQEKGKREAESGGNAEPELPHF